MANRSWALTLLLVAVAGCGGDRVAFDGKTRTVAYVAIECREDANGRLFRQELRVQRNEDAAVIVVQEATEADLQPDPLVVGLCLAGGLSRGGFPIAQSVAFRRLAVSPDGSTLVFEKVNGPTSILQLPSLLPERTGFFVVQADGSGLRRLGPPSEALDSEELTVSADGRTIVFMDRGSGSSGGIRDQVFTLDLVTRERRQMTQLPCDPTPGGVCQDACCTGFQSDGRIFFGTCSDPIGVDPDHRCKYYTIRPDGTDLKVGSVDVAGSSSTILDPTFQVTGERVSAFTSFNPGGAQEVFLLDGNNRLQLTNFQLGDTRASTVGTDNETVLLIASDDPFGTNPTGNCQIFSIDRLGGDLRQLTRFSQGEHSIGCSRIEIGGLPGCHLSLPRQDQQTGAVVFASTCDPFGANPFGEQIFAMGLDGTDMRQLTHMRGFSEAMRSLT